MQQERYDHRAVPFVRRAASILAWPTLVSLSLAFTAWAVRTRALEPELAAALAGVLVAAACVLLERLLPFRPEWSRASLPDDRRADALFALLGVLLAPAALRALAQGALVRGALTLGALVHRPTLWPTGWPLAAQVALALLLSELGGYWIHRLQHERPWAWPVHAIHHEPARVYFFNGYRLHPGDTLMTLVGAVFPLLLLGAPADVMALLSAIASAHLPLQHVNADLRFGPLERWISTPTLHRWHHSTDRRESDSNYGGILIVWDVLFRTYRPSKDGERSAPERVGLHEGERVPRSALAMLWWPVRRMFGAA